MHGLKKLALFMGALLPLASALPQAINKPTGSEPPVVSEPIPNKYIVTLKKSVSDLDSHLTWVDGMHARSLGRRQLGLAGVEDTYNSSNFHGYAGAFDKATIAEIKTSPEVATVEQDEMWHLEAVPKTQKNVPSWGLAAISNPAKTGGHGKLSGGSYVYDKSAGQGTYAYVIDSGVNVAHEDFGGRATLEYNTMPQGAANADTSGHGTHVAGIIAGTTYGVAKKAKIIAVKVFADRPAYDLETKLTTPKSNILAGFEWAVADIIAKRRQTVSVINMSVGGHQSNAMNTAVDAAYDRGILTVVAAGNSAVDASSISPASAAKAFTVGATDSSNRVAGFSNYGPHVNILAPGVEITSAWIRSKSGNAAMSGTSQAAPHVAGLALYLMALEGLKTPGAVVARIMELSISGLIQGIGPAEGTLNRFAYNNADALKCRFPGCLAGSSS